jgi:death-on-curing protein
MTRYVTFDGLVAYHRGVMAEHGQHATLMWPDRLQAAIERPTTEAFSEEAFPTLVEKAGVLLQSVVIGRPFMDGNKRAALGAMLAFLELNGVPLEAEEDPLYDFVIGVTTGELREVADIAARLRVLFAPHLD